MIKDVYIRTRPGADSSITDSLMIGVSDVIRDAGLTIVRNEDEINKETLILALGGDGTMLSAMHIAAKTGALVTGFNYGNLGYLVPDYAKGAQQLIGKLQVMFYDLLQPAWKNMANDPSDVDKYKITGYKLPVLSWKNHTAINDFYFVPSANGSAADFRVTIGEDSSHFSTKSSGMVVSTPFGSTGLALSAGGSILSPNTGVLEVVPMLPHTLTSRPIIVPDDDTIVVSWERKVKVFADGKLVDDFGEGEATINCLRSVIRIIQPKGWDFFENLKNKMNWHS